MYDIDFTTTTTSTLKCKTSSLLYILLLEPSKAYLAQNRLNYVQSNIFHKNREISILTIKKKTARLTLPQEATERTKQGETKNKTKNEKHTPRYEQKCQSHTCSETINSSMYDSDLTITT
jgi:hypothetical protein